MPDFIHRILFNNYSKLNLEVGAISFGAELFCIKSSENLGECP